MRIFIAIVFSPAIKNEISNIIDSIEEKNYHGQVTAHDNLHMTLYYLGETKNEKIQEVIHILHTISFNSFCIKTNSLDTFKKNKKKKILYLGLEKSDLLMQLHDEVIKALNNIGYSIDELNFTPHITLMRKLDIAEDDIQNFNIKKLDIQVNSISVMESKRVNGKLVYEEIEKITLKK